VTEKQIDTQLDERQGSMGDLNSVKLDFTAVMNVGRDEEMQTLLSALEKLTVKSGDDHADAGDDNPTTSGLNPGTRQNKKRQRNSTSSAIFIQGAPGIGKSVLVDAFWKQSVTSAEAAKNKCENATATATQCLFCRSKFEEGRSDSDPFYAITTCFNMLIQSLLKDSSTDMPTSNTNSTKSTLEASSQSNNEAYWKARFTEALKEEAPILGTIIPWFSELAEQIGPVSSRQLEQENVSNRQLLLHQDSTSSRDLVSLERFRIALRNLLRCITQTDAVVVVMVLDDLQWAGREALALLRSLLTDKILAETFVFVGTHRPVVGPSKDGLEALYSALPQEQRTEIQLTSLTKEALSELLCRLLRREVDETKSLVEAIHSRTGGNPFFVIKFLQQLEDRGLLAYSLLSYRWEWETERIYSETDISDNVVDIIAIKIREMPKRQQIVVLAAACLMLSIFHVDTLFHILAAASIDTAFDDNGEQSPDENKEIEMIDSVEELRSVLLEATRDGLLEDMNDGLFKFSHTRIREGAYSLVPGGIVRQEIHLRIGRQLRLLRQENPDNSGRLHHLLFQTVRQLNLGTKLITSETEMTNLAELNYQAAELAVQRSSFFPASDFLRASLDLLGESPWVGHYDLCLKVSIAQMRIEYCCGRPVVSVYIADDVLDHARTFLERKAAYHTKLLWLTHDGKSKEAMHLVLSVLKELGAPFPRRFLQLHVMKEVIRTKKMLRGQTDAELLALPDTQSETINDIADFVERLGELALNSANPSPEYLALALLRAIQMTLSHGRFASTSGCFMAWGWFSAQVGWLDEAHRFGRLGLKIADQGKGGHHDTRAVLVYYLQIYHWRLPYHDGLTPTSNALRSLWDRGSIEYVFSDTVTYLRIYFCCGLSLKPLQSDIQTFVDLLRDYGNALYFGNHIPFFQMISNLMGTSNQTFELSGEFMNQSDSIRQWSKSGNEMALQQIYFHRMMLAYFFNDLELAGQMSQKMWSPNNEGPDVVSSLSTLSCLPFVDFLRARVHAIVCI
jgi:predicted ATPase